MCVVLLPPGVDPIAVIYTYIVSLHFTSGPLQPVTGWTLPNLLTCRQRQQEPSKFQCTSATPHGVTHRKKVIFFLPFFLVWPTYLLIESTERYCCTLPHTVTRGFCSAPLDERSVRRRDLYITTQHLKKHKHSCFGGIRTRNPRKRGAPKPTP
jgi:hypothetical protein